MKVAEAAFWANKIYFDTCENLKGKVDPKMVDFDAYPYFMLMNVPLNIDFDSKNNLFLNPKKRVQEFSKYLFFAKPKDLNIFESKDADSAGLLAVCDYLISNGFECRVDWQFWG